MLTASLWRNQGRLWLRFDYSASFVETLKCEFPKWSRQYHADLRAWSFDFPMLERLLRLCRDYFRRVDVAPDLLPTPTLQSSPYDQLLRGLPFSVLHKIYRLIMLEVHPDRGGNTKQAQRVNAAWCQIEDSLGERR